MTGQQATTESIPKANEDIDLEEKQTEKSFSCIIGDIVERSDGDAQPINMDVEMDESEEAFPKVKRIEQKVLFHFNWQRAAQLFYF